MALDRAAPAGGVTVSVDVTESGSYIAETAPDTVFIAAGATTVMLAVSTDDDSIDEDDGSITAELNAGAGYTVGTPNTATVTVTDDDVLLASITAADPTTITEGTAATFKVTLSSGAPASGLTISVTVTESGSYISGPAPETVVIASGATTSMLTVTTADDTTDEPEGSITATINMGTSYRVRTPNTAMVTVIDDDVLIASITASPSPITEGTDATFTVRLSSAAPAGGLTISVGVTDYGRYIADPAPETVFIAAGATTVTLTVSTEDDNLSEFSGSIIAVINAGAGYTVAPPPDNRARVRVLDNDEPIVEIYADSLTITEGADATFILFLSSRAPGGGLTVSVTVTESGSYIAGSIPTEVFIAAGRFSFALTIPTADDNLGEGGVITVVINAGTGYTVGPQSTFMVTVLDNDVIGDADGDGLIEIRTLTQLNSIRYNLAGTHAMTGCPTLASPIWVHNTTGEVLIFAPVDPTDYTRRDTCYGYELVRSLDFNDANNDGNADDAYNTDLDTTNGNWMPIGEEDFNVFGDPFTGTFDGNGNTISNMFVAITRTSARLGLFGVIGRGAVIRDVGLVGASVRGTSARSDAGGLAGVSGGTISGSYVTGSVSGVGYRVGGLVGWNNGTIRDSYAASSVRSTGTISEAGGLVGYNIGTISGSYVTGSVSNVGYRAGGLVGRNDGTIRDSYAASSVRVTDDNSDHAGGLVGWNDGDIENSYATGSVSGGFRTGGLVGWNNAGTIRNSYATGSVSGTGAGGLVGWNNAGTIRNSYATGSVSGTGAGGEAGGLVGLNNAGSTIRDSYATGSVRGTSSVGGLVGINSGTIRNSYAIGSVTSDFYFASGLVGVNGIRGTIQNSYWNTETSGNRESAGGIGQTTLQLVTPTFTTGSIYESWTARSTALPGESLWDFGDNRQYPGLRLPLSTDDCTVSAETPLCTHRTADPDPTARISAGPSSITEGTAATFTVTLDLAAPASGLTISVDVTESGSYILSPAPATVVLASGAMTVTLTVSTEDDEMGEPSGTITVRITTGAGYTVGDAPDNQAAVIVFDDETPVDEDGDGLIEIRTLTQLNNIRYNLAGTSTVNTLVPDAPGNTVGCPTLASPIWVHNTAGDVLTSAPSTQDTASYTRRDTCYGYELVRSLDFNDANNDGNADDAYDTDLDTTNGNWRPIGRDFANSFSGTFDGNGNTISNMSVAITSASAGLFGTIGADTVIRDVGLVGVSVRSDAFSAGGLVGDNEGTIRDSYATGSVTGGGDIGGLVGDNRGTIRDSYATGSVTGGGDIGGLVGDNRGTIRDSYATGSVSGDNENEFASIGGLVGYNEGTIRDSYATGSVTGGGDIGGLVGANNGGTIRDSYATGSVTGGGENEFASIGGLVGYNEGTIRNSYWNTETSGQLASDGGIGQNTLQLVTPTSRTGSIYESWTAESTALPGELLWDFGDNRQYPGLRLPLSTADCTVGAGTPLCTHRPADPDDPVASITANPLPITEGTAATFRVTLGSAAPAGGLTINVAVTESGNYIAATAPATVFIAAGARTGTLAVLTEDDDLGERSGSITVRITTGAGYTVAPPPDNAAVETVLDNETPVASITAADPTTITEFGGYCQQLSAEPGATIQFIAGRDGVDVGYNDPATSPVGNFGSFGSSQNNSFMFNGQNIIIDAIFASSPEFGFQFSVTPNIERELMESNCSLEISNGNGESVNVNFMDMSLFGGSALLLNPGIYPTENEEISRIIINGQSFSLRILSNISTPTSAGPTTITEGADATFRVTLGSAAPAGGLTVSVTVTESGSYIAGSAPETVVIAAGATTGTLAVSTEDDEMIERSGTITVRITTGAGYTVADAPDHQAAVTVLDDEAPVASITSADPTPITEGTAATFRVTLNRAAPAGGLTVRVRVTESGSYIDGSAPATVVIASGATTGTLAVSTEDDSLDEPEGIITVTINAGTDYTVAVAPDNQAEVTVLDNDGPVASISADSLTITEGAVATFTVALNRVAPAGGLRISVAWTIENGFMQIGAFLIRSGGRGFSLLLRTEDDSLDEPVGSVTVTINAGTGYTVGTQSMARVTVLDNDDPVASITADQTTITEGADATFTVTLSSAAPASGLTINVDVTESGSYIDDLAPETVVIASGATTGTLTVSTEDDRLDESDGTITVRITTGAGYTVADAPDNAAAVTVLDDETPVVSITADPPTITEGADATFTVTLSSAAPVGGVTVSVRVTESGSYIEGLAPTEVVIAEGATTGTLMVTTADDTTDEPAGSITAELNAGTGYTVGTPSTAMVAVSDDDDPVASITAVDPTTITEGTAATFTVTLSSAAPAGGLTISVGVTQSGSYIDGAAPETVVITAGATTVTLAVPTVDDSLDEPDGSITVRITTGAGYTVGTPNPAMVTVNDNDDPVASITADPPTITEGNAATFTVTLSSAAPAGGLTISVRVTDSGSYIAGPVPTEVVIAEGATTGTLMVTTADDTTDEPVGSITAELNAGIGYTVGTPSTAMVTVNDNDAPVASITAVGPTTITEGTTARFTVTLGSAAPADGLPISVRVTQSGSYIVGAAPETVVITAGATTVTLAVPTVDDSLDEPDGSITVRITTGAGYTVGTPNPAMVTVNDNDDPVARISADPTPITEGATATFRVTLGTAAPAGGLMISVGVTDSGSYIDETAPATVVITSGAMTGTLTVLTEDDRLDESDGIITAELNAGAGYTVGTPSTAMVTVNDNDDPAASITADPPTITEGNAATFTVTLSSAAPAGGLTISVRVTDSGSYIAGPVPTEVVITAGATTVTLAVSTEDDTTDEPAGSITAELNAGTGYTVGTPSTAMVTVNDNDDRRVASFGNIVVTVSEGSPVMLTVQLSTDSSEAVVVSITSDDTSRVSSATFTIPAGMTTEAVQLSTAFDRDTATNMVEVSIDMSTGDNIGTGGGENGYVLDTDTVATITVEDTNGPPIITTTSFTVTENVLSAGQVVATDGDAADSINRYTISGGADDDLFNLDADTRALSFMDAPNFEMPRGSPLSETNLNIYELIVEVSSGDGPREFTATATITVEVEDDNTEAPSAPAMPTVTPVGFTSLRVTWAAPANMGPAITGYTVEYRPASSSGEWSDAGHTGTNPTATITGLDSNTLHAVRVQARNAEGDGMFSPVGQMMTLDLSRPTNVVVTAPLDSSTSLSVTWSAVASATSYNVQYRQDTTESYMSTGVTVDNDAQTAIITGLTPGTSYQVQVSAVIAADGVNSDFSPPIPGTTNRVVDTDSDGLIDISTLAELNNIRNDLAGASYKDTPGGSGLTTGCPDAGCVGYELMNSLNFADADNNPATTNDNYDTDSDGSNGNWMPIGGASDPLFTRTFEGNGYTISNLSVIIPSRSEIGLFGETMNSTAIRNVGLTAVSLEGNNMVGGLVGLNTGTISGSYVITGTGSSVTGSDSTGGLVGDNDGTISNSYVIGSVMGRDGVGGLVGNNGGTSGSISNSYATGSVTSSRDFAGGLVGYNTRTISNSYATGSVSGSDHIGGLVGHNENGSSTYEGVTRNSYAIGVVTGTGSNVGGLIGSNSGPGTPIAANSYWNTETSRQSMSPGGSGATGLTTLQLVTPTSTTGSIYELWTAEATGFPGELLWDFGDNRQYPGLRLPLSTDDCTVSAGTPLCTHRPADPGPVASITAATPTTITEGAVASFTVTLEEVAPAGGLTVSVAVTESGSYIDGSAPTEVVIVAGETTGTLMVTTTDDTTDEPAGSIIAEITAPTDTGYTVGTPNTAMVTVNDNDDPAASITADSPTITEGATATFTVTLSSAAPVGGVTVSVGVTESGSYIDDLAPGTVVIAERETTGTLMVTTTDDTTDEDDGSITATINAGTSYTVSTLSTARVTVNDDDDPVASISVGPSPITEGATATFTVTLSSAAPAGGLTINVGVAESDSYIADSAPMMVVIAGGATTGRLIVRTTDDTTDERAGSITATITAGAGYTVGTPSTAMVTVNDNDDPAASISAGPSPITEGATATFTVTLSSAAPAGGLTISVGVTERGSYIDGTAPGTVDIASGAMSVTLTVSTEDDTMDESAGSITTTINAGTSYTVGTPNTARVTVNDDDPPTAGAGPARQDAQAGASVRLLGTARDPDNDRLSYSWTRTQEPAGDGPVDLVGFNTARKSPTFTVSDDAPVGTIITFRLTVTDEDGASAVSSPVTVELIAGVNEVETRDGSNVLPSLTIETPAGEPEVVYIQEITQIDPEADDLMDAVAVAVARPLSARSFVRDETIYDISLTTRTLNQVSEPEARTDATELTSRRVCLPISRQVYNALNGNLRVNRNIAIFHFTDGDWNRLESTINEERTAICANPPSLSPFTIGYALPEDRQSDTSILLPITGGITPPWWLTLTLVLTGAGSLLLGSSLLLRGRVLGRVRSYARLS